MILNQRCFNFNFPWPFFKMSLSLTQNKTPWLFPDLEEFFPLTISWPDLWQPYYIKHICTFVLSLRWGAVSTRKHQQSESEVNWFVWNSTKPRVLSPGIVLWMAHHCARGEDCRAQLWKIWIGLSRPREWMWGLLADSWWGLRGQWNARKFLWSCNSKAREVKRSVYVHSFPRGRSVRYSTLGVQGHIQSCEGIS